MKNNLLKGLNMDSIPKMETEYLDAPNAIKHPIASGELVDAFGKAFILRGVRENEEGVYEAIDMDGIKCSLFFEDINKIIGDNV